ncbi:MAG: hypothetical protein F6K42_11280 [Leptolyngbya sp. SIO1D8]|nr:hypothetical protein [Leptolyngbya sp. SIO1D8]
MTSNQSDRLEQAKALYAAGQLAFEHGNYREAVSSLEAGSQLAGGATSLGGMIQLWLMNAYFAANRPQEAIALGEKLAKHPDGEVRKQSQRVVEILKAPQLKRRADWVTPIPDLSNLEAGNENRLTLSQYGSTKATPKAISLPPSPPEDLSQINTRDNGFLWIALVAIILTLGGLYFL